MRTAACYDTYISDTNNLLTPSAHITYVRLQVLGAECYHILMREAPLEKKCYTSCVLVMTRAHTSCILVHTRSYTRCGTRTILVEYS